LALCLSSCCGIFFQNAGVKIQAMKSVSREFISGFSAEAFFVDDNNNTGNGWFSAPITDNESSPGGKMFAGGWLNFNF
jgi:hypothetical protein